MTEVKFDGWISIFESGIDYEAEMVRDRLVDSGISAVLMTKKDRAFGLSVGSMSRIYVLVVPDEEQKARALIQDYSFSAEELTEAALAANPEDVDGPPKGSTEE